MQLRGHRSDVSDGNIGGPDQRIRDEDLAASTEEELLQMQVQQASP